MTMIGYGFVGMLGSEGPGESAPPTCSFSVMLPYATAKPPISGGFVESGWVFLFADLSAQSGQPRFGEA